VPQTLSFNSGLGLNFFYEFTLFNINEETIGEGTNYNIPQRSMFVLFGGMPLLLACLLVKSFLPN